MSGDVWINAGVPAMGAVAAGTILGAAIGLAARKCRAPGHLLLVCIGGPAAGQCVRLNGAALCIGRAPGCDIVIDDAHASRRHACLIPGAWSATLRDLGSSAGVWIDGARVFDVALHPGDQFQIGAHVFALQQRADVMTMPRRHLPEAALAQPAHAGLADIELGDVLRTGAHFTVVRARSFTQAPQSLVVKFLNQAGSSDARTRARFDRYLRQAMCLHHPHIVAVKGGSSSSQPPFVIEACAAGGSLAARMAVPLGADEARQVLSDLCEALAHLHAQGIAHGALSPTDVLFGDNNRAWLANAGLARVYAREDQPERDRMRADVNAFADVVLSLLGERPSVRNCADAVQLLALWRGTVGAGASGSPGRVRAARAQSSGFGPLRLQVLATRQVVAVTGNPFPLGRALNPADRSLSRLHAELRFEDNTWRITPLTGADADNLSLNGKPVAGAQVIAAGDELMLGATAVRIME